jgi:hypothetical protein
MAGFTLVKHPPKSDRCPHDLNIGLDRLFTVQDDGERIRLCKAGHSGITHSRVRHSVRPPGSCPDRNREEKAVQPLCPAFTFRVWVNNVAKIPVPKGSELS